MSFTTTNDFLCLKLRSCVQKCMGAMTIAKAHIQGKRIDIVMMGSAAADNRGESAPKCGPRGVDACRERVDE